MLPRPRTVVAAIARTAWAAIVLLAAGVAAAASPSAPGVTRATRHTAPVPPTVAILCYHDVSNAPGTPLQTVSPEFLRAQIRASKRAGWTFVSLRELLAQRDHPERLPARAMVLTFDDAYRSFRDVALPILHDERVPATLAVISSFVERPPADMPILLGWEELRALARDSLVEIASHSHDLHRYERSNPYRDTAPSGATRRYVLAEARYENREEYRARIAADLAAAQRTLRAELGHDAQVLVWPFGAANTMTLGIAENAGFRATLALGGRAVTAADLRAGTLPRIMVTRTMRFADGDESWLHAAPAAMRAAEVDLDALYDPDPAVFRPRVESLVRRLRAIGATHALLETCANPAHDGRLRGAWFMNHQVAVRADVWSMVASQLAHARIKVWARVPTMNLTWAWQQHPEWRVSRAPDGFGGKRAGGTARSAVRPLERRVTRSLEAWPTRLSPDLPEARRAAIDFLTDLAVYAPIDGVVFDDDAFMAPGERLTFTRSADPLVRAEAIEELLDVCRDAVRQWRPECAFGRIVAPEVVQASGLDPGLSQDFARIVRDDGLAIVTVDPWNDPGVTDPARWLESLGRRAVSRAVVAKADAARGTAAGSVLIALDSYDSRASRWVPARDLSEGIAALRRAGLANLGVFPVSPLGAELPDRLFERTEPSLATEDGPQP